MTWVFCKFHICGNDCGIAETLKNEEDKQSKANAHIKRTTLLLDNHCTIDNNNDTEKIMKQLHYTYCVKLFKVSSTSGVARLFAMPGHWMGKPPNLTAHIHMPIFICILKCVVHLLTL